MNGMNLVNRAGSLICLAVVVVLLSVGCGGEAGPAAPESVQPMATTPIEVATEVVVAATPTANSLEGTATARAATAAAPTIPPTIPPPATLTPAPTEEAPTPTPAGTPTPYFVAELERVDQAPYAASDCSDKYPCNDDIAGWEARLRVPEGFQAEYWAWIEGVNPNVITFGPDGKAYVATMQGDIWTIDRDRTIEKVFSGLLTPTGLAFMPNTNRLYVSSRLLELNEDGEAQVGYIENGKLSQVVGGLPCCYTFYHSANGIAFGPDGYGYVGVGARADHGEILSGPNAGRQDELQPYEASILRFSPDGKEVEVYARGFRNPYDIAFDADGQLYATDNNADFGPPEVIHKVVPGAEHGYPWYGCEGCFPKPADVELVPPIATFVSHASPTGITTYRDTQWPGMFNSVFLTLWSAFEGAQKIVRLMPGGENPTDFMTGMAAPIDLEVGPDGNMYVADWATGIIFRISHVGE